MYFVFLLLPVDMAHHFKQVIVIYCTSDLYSGDLPKQGDLQFDFFGSRVVPSVLQDLGAKLSAATDVLFTGGSAGGIGTFVNYGYVKEALSHAHVRALPDAGWFLTTVKDFDAKAVPVTEQLEKGMSLWHGQPPQKCALALGSNAWQCYSGPVVCSLSEICARGLPCDCFFCRSHTKSHVVVSFSTPTRFVRSLNFLCCCSHCVPVGKVYNFMPSPASDMFVQKAQTDAWTVGNDGAGKPPFNAKEIEWLMELAAEVRTTLLVDKVSCGLC